MAVPAHTVTCGVVGTDRSGKSIFNRIEIVPFMANTMQFSLYVQALAHMMTVDPTSWTSYYQIAAIHGAPYTPYDGAGATFVSPMPLFMGYCSHYSVLFPTWHRPYMALIEQEIQKIALDIANRYTNFKEDWVDAAIQLRHPYWDWSKTARPPREIYADEQLEVLLPPLGEPGKMNNPFLRYAFQRKSPSFPYPFSEPGWDDTTHRYGKEDANYDIVDSLEELEAALSDQELDKRKLATGTLLLGNTANTWEAFSNDNQGMDPRPAQTSLETLHGNIHFHVGGGLERGHMSNPAVAAFDPFFWLHHAQTDRLLALWAALHPDVWVTPSREPEGTWTIPTRGPIDETTSLTPFYCGGADGQFWTSADLREPTDGLFGYSYEEFNGVDWSDKAAVRAHVKTIVEQLYPLPTVLARWMNFDAGASHPVCPRLPSAIPAKIITPAVHPRAVLRWTAHITAKKHALRGSFAVLLFLGEAPALPGDFLSSANFVGDYCAFVNPAPERCANCLRQGNITIGGGVDLTDALVRRAEVGSLHPEEVVPYLRRKLCWRVWTGAGPAVHPSEVEELEVDVSATPHYMNEHNEITVGAPIVYHEVTRGSPGGCRHFEKLTAS
ncbi:Di-copper centre-containing protein [Lenzites betulinus]|nr:Di-copper centre-containing protein [Lenzites betulinus]